MLLDLSMPEMDGSELLGRLQDLHPTLPVVMMSGHDQAVVRDRIGNRRIAAVLRKPFEVNDLREAIGAAQRGEAAAPTRT